MADREKCCAPRPEHVDESFLELVFHVAKEFAGWRADRFVAHKIPRLSRTRVQRILKRFAFDEDGKPIKPNRVLRADEHITVYKQPPDEPDVVRDFSVVYEDERLICVDKPAGLPVHPTARYLKNTLTALLEERYPGDRPVLTHRLDSETSGLVLCAKDIEAERRIKKMFADRKISKKYLAVVQGVLDPSKGRIEAPLGFDPDSVIKVKIGCFAPDALPALTEYETLRTGGDRALVELRPRTGRQHQLRAHLAHIGHPIIGDKMYGPDEGIFLEYIESGMTEELAARAGHHRHALHAFSLTFVHPFDGEELTIETPLPDDIEGLMR